MAPPDPFILRIRVLWAERMACGGADKQMEVVVGYLFTRCLFAALYPLVQREAAAGTGWTEMICAFNPSGDV